MYSSKNYYIEIECHQENKFGNKVCGDVFLSKKIKAENRSIAVLSDGLGSGIKANILATMTASMALNFTAINEPVTRTAKTIMNTLPVDADRQISYSTFSILSIDSDGETKIIEYDNPVFILIRNNEVQKIAPKAIQIETGGKTKTLLRYHFHAQKEDRILLFTDGITQAGIGSAQFPFGWSEEGVQEYVQEILKKSKDISAKELSKLVLEKARMYDGLKFKDDAACVAIYFRSPRRLLICSGPPYQESSDSRFAELVNTYNGKRIICGGTTAQIISRENNTPINTDLISLQSELPPESTMQGVDLISEGILTIGKVVEILEHELNYNDPKFGAAGKIVQMLFENDYINFLIGTKVNNAHQDPTLPVELEIRRSVLKKMATLLENKYLKEVRLDFI